MIKYPHKVDFQTPTKKAGKTPTKSKVTSYANRGMLFENEISLSNQFYRDHGRAVITKRPTPINVVKVDYKKGARIVDGFFEKQSTTDYNGVYRGRYIDIEAKVFSSKTSFPIANIQTHQLDHLKQVIHHGGIAFFLIEACDINEVYLLDAQFVIDWCEKAERKSIPLSVIKTHGHLVEQGYAPRYMYLDVVDKLYF